MRSLQPRLESLRQRHRYRARRLVTGVTGPEQTVDGRPMLLFCSNDYLGLAGDPRVVEALCRGASEQGAGSGSAHLVAGHGSAHHALEEALAGFTGRPRALLFSTGYMANLGVISALCGPADRLHLDRLDHASLLDGARLSGARFRRYPHGDVAVLERRLQRQAAEGRTLVATDGVFSMDGDLAPLPQLAGLCRRHGAWLLVDDAHGLGVLGEDGGGSLARFGLGPEEVPILVGTLGKAFGTAGAFVAGSEELIETLIQDARSYLFTTAPPPAVAAATLVSLELAREEGWRRRHLEELIVRFRREAGALGLPLMPSDTPIQPILAGGAERALAWARQLEEAGILVTPIRPPTVPEGSARLRVTLSAAHTDSHLDRLLEALSRLPVGPDR